MIETTRLLLREVELGDAEGFFEMDRDPLVARYVGNKPVQHLEESIKVIEFVQSQYVQYGIGRLSVIDKASGAFLGWCGLKRMKDTGVNGNDDFIDLGYRFMQKHWGKGYATESAQAVLDYGLNTLGFPLINAIARVENVASVRVLTKIGMLPGNEFEWEGHCVWFEKRRAP